MDQFRLNRFYQHSSNVSTFCFLGQQKVQRSKKNANKSKLVSLETECTNPEAPTLIVLNEAFPEQESVLTESL